MKTLKQRFTIWFNRTHDRFGTLWSERFKSVLVEGRGNPLQTMAAYIDLNAVRAGLVQDPKDYRFCGYAEAVSGRREAKDGLRGVWGDYAGKGENADRLDDAVLRAHRRLMFTTGWNDESVSREAALKVLEKEDGVLPKAAVLRCRVRYFTDGAILGSREFVEEFVGTWQAQRERKRPPKPQPLKGADWGDLAVIRGLRKQVFS